MKTISIPTNDRTAHLARVLESVKTAMRHSQGWTLVFSCEPVAAMIEAVQQVDWAPIYVQRNSARMGCWSNTFRAADLAMAVGSTLNLYLEDDTVVSEDALAMVDQWNVGGMLGVIAFRRPEAAIQPVPDTVARFDGGLFGDGFAWRRELWPVVRECWFEASHQGYSMWDWSMEDGLKALKVRQMRPCLNRSQNIGIQGTHQRGYDANRHSPCYGGPPVQTFRFV